MPPPHRGRRRGRRWISREPHVTYFGPPGEPLAVVGAVVLSFAEVEALRLADLEGLSQEKAAERMGVSRRTLWSDLKAARVKVATALVKGLPIRIEGGDYEVRRRGGAP